MIQNITLAAVYTGIGTETGGPPRQILQGARREEVIKIIESSLKERRIFE